MKYASGSAGRIFTVRFEEGDAIYDGIAGIAQSEGVARGVVWILGGVKNGGVVVGPSNDTMPPLPMVETFTDPREIVATGTIFPDEKGRPSLHIHASIGKDEKVIVGCPRKGLDCWLVTEAVIMEILGCESAKRLENEKSGFSLLEIENGV